MRAYLSWDTWWSYFSCAMDATSATKMHFQSDMVCTVKLTQSTQSPRGIRFTRWEIRFSFGLIYWPFSEDLNHVVSWHTRHGKILIKKMKIVIQLVATMEMDNSGHILAMGCSSSHPGSVPRLNFRLKWKIQEPSKINKKWVFTLFELFNQRQNTS